jgi:hypothetical protein
MTFKIRTPPATPETPTSPTQTIFKMPTPPATPRTPRTPEDNPATGDQKHSDATEYNNLRVGNPLGKRRLTYQPVGVQARDNPMSGY